MFETIVRLLLLNEVRAFLKFLWQKRVMSLFILPIFIIGSCYLLYYHSKIDETQKTELRSNFLLHTLERRVVSKRILNVLHSCSDKTYVSWIKIITVEKQGRWIYIDTFKCNNGKCNATYNKCRQPLYRLDDVTKENLDEIEAGKIFTTNAQDNLSGMYSINEKLPNMPVISKLMKCLDVEDYIHFGIKKGINDNEYYIFTMSFTQDAIDNNILKCRYGLYDISRDVSLQEARGFFQ